MKKKYLHDRYGSDDAFWDASWGHDWSTRSAFPLAVDPVLVREMLPYLAPGASVLEGGCGNCHYLRWLCSVGCKPTGVDFAQKTVKAATTTWPDLDVRVGDITNLAFETGHFDAYYSGGVIEHFEEGPAKALAEARRVLKADGWLLVTVPHLNLARRLTGWFFRNYRAVDLDGRDAYIIAGVDSFSASGSMDGFHFHEYAFSTREMRQFLAQSGFTIDREVPFSSSWGLLDIDWFHRFYLPAEGGRKWWNRVLGIPIRCISFIEGRDQRMMRALAAWIGGLVGNLKLYACRPVPIPEQCSR